MFSISLVDCIAMEFFVDYLSINDLGSPARKRPTGRPFWSYFECDPRNYTSKYSAKESDCLKECIRKTQFQEKTLAVGPFYLSHG